ncbi:transferrin-binding protein-like solute binding protein [Conchiformibius kuhniae]|nr:transferrin-binding protein-like solute binding protein [Conchiformibius kuhniae]
MRQHVVSDFDFSQQGGQVIDGAFFGKDAAELAGVFYKNKDNANTVGDFLGAFGANKQQ